MTMGEAFQTIAQACFDQFLLNEASVRDLRDPEAVHQCRVALRRLRAAMRLFQVRQDESWRADLKRLLALLRDARDLDVLLAEQIKPLLAEAPNPRLSGFLGEIELRRETAYDKLVAALQATQTKRFFLHLALWIEAGDFGDRHVWTENFLGFARQRLAKNTRKLLKRGALVETHSDEERHETRIFAKNLRYSAEFMELLLSGKAARGRYEDLLDAVKQIQQIFGEYNDAIAARQFFAERADNPLAPDREDGAAVHEIHEPASPIDPEAEAAFLRKAKRAFRNLAETKPFWDKIPDPPDRRKPKFKSAEI
jgi:CHAD domain-containing protein